MFKLLVIGGLIYLFYRITFLSGKIEGPKGGKEQIREQNREDDYIDYEEVD
ncbi:MAG: hypothetical protein AAGG75_00760 [Bacteroidota bacterium]